MYSNSGINDIMIRYVPSFLTFLSLYSFPYSSSILFLSSYLYPCLCALHSSISDAAGASILDELGVLPEGTALSLGLGRLPLLAALGELLLGNLEVEDLLLGVDDDGVAVADKADGATLHGLGHDVADEEAVRTAGEAAVGDEGNVLAKTVAHDGRRGLEHLGHAGTALGTLVADDDNGLLALLDLAALEGLNEAILVVEAAGLALEAETLLASDLADGTAGGKRAAEDLNVAGLLDGVGERADDGLVAGEIGELLDVLLHGLTGRGHAGAVDDALLEEELEKGRGAADLAEVLHDPLAGRLEVSKEGGAVGNGLEVVDGELDANGVGDGDQVEDGVGGTAENVDDDHGVLEGLAGKDIGGADILTEEVLDGLTDAQALVLLLGRLGGEGGGTGKGHAEGLDGSGHGVGSVHTTAGATTRAGVADDIEALLLVDLAGDVLAVSLEGGDNVDVLALHVAAGLDGTTVDHDGGAVDTAHGDEDTGHVLVAAGEGDVGVVPLAVHDGLDGVGNNLTRLQAVAHTGGTHGDTVRDTDGVEAHGDEASLGDGLLDEAREVEKVHVARVAVIPDRRDTDLGLVHVVLVEAGGVEHGLGSTLGLGLGDGGRHLVELAGLLLGIVAAGSRGEGAAGKGERT